MIAKRNAGGILDFEYEESSKEKCGCVLKKKKGVHNCINEYILYCVYLKKT